MYIYTIIRNANRIACVHIHASSRTAPFINRCLFLLKFLLFFSLHLLHKKKRREKNGATPTAPLFSFSSTSLG